MRIVITGNTLRNVEIGFWGAGIYANKDTASALPGILRMLNECGVIFSAFVLTLMSLRILKYKKFDTILLIGALLPFLTEAYGSPILWFTAFLYIASSKRGMA